MKRWRLIVLDRPSRYGAFVPRVIRKYLTVWASAAIAVASLCVVVIFGTGGLIGSIAQASLAISCAAGYLALRYIVFSSSHHSTVYIPGQHPDDKAG